MHLRSLDQKKCFEGRDLNEGLYRYRFSTNRDPSCGVPIRTRDCILGIVVFQG